MNIRRAGILIPLTLLFLLTTAFTQAQETARPAGWDEYAHGSDTPPDYAIVFPQDAVNTINITISPENWQAMQDDMTELFGEFGQNQRGGASGRPPANGGGRPPGGDGQNPPAGGGQGGPPAGGAFNFAAEDPVWVTADISFNGQVWSNVGLRYKGNSTLMGAWGSGLLKLGFKLNFDKFEDDYPAIDNQRFFGFDELSFSSNYRDPSYLHEKVAADIFRDAGLVAANTAFYAVYMDYGQGSVYIGLYTAVEEIEDTVLQTQFTDDSGNLYKPEGTGAAFQAGTFTESGFEKKTNEDEADYSDILALFDALHASTRATQPEAWRAGLEAVLNVDQFLHWLAVNTVITNWDTYGTMAHNYYLYNDPATGLLNWIPWDNNEALTAGRRATSAIDLATITADWPLIRYLMDDPVYQSRYREYVAGTIAAAFDPATMAETYQTFHDLITPYVLGDGASQPADPALTSEEVFLNSVTVLIQHTESRYTLAQQYLSAP